MIADPFQGWFLPGEHVVWRGRPALGIVFTAHDIWLIPFSLLWCGFAIFWDSVAIDYDAPIFDRLWGATFVCIGLFMVVGRFVVDAWLRDNLYYAITDQRILIVRTGLLSKLNALGIFQLPLIHFDERAHGRGTIRFGEVASLWGNRSWGQWIPSLEATPQFIMIDDVRRVYGLIQHHSIRSA